MINLFIVVIKEIPRFWWCWKVVGTSYSCITITGFLTRWIINIAHMRRSVFGGITGDEDAWGGGV